MINLFITVRLLDVIDILLFAVLLFQAHRLLKGTAAMNIFVGVFALYLVWLFVKALNMHLLSSILGQFIGVGVIALIIVFQPELRKGLLLLGTRNIKNHRFSFLRYLLGNEDHREEVKVDEIVLAARMMSETRTGALMVFKKDSDLDALIQIKEVLNAETSHRLLLSIFSKESPLHDGAVIIADSKILAARCILPLSDQNFDENYGTRHRAAVGITEQSDAVVVVVSEETGNISFAKKGKIRKLTDAKRIATLLTNEFQKEKDEKSSANEKFPALKK